MRKLGVSRRELFENIERAALRSLPDADWEFAEWKRARVNLDYTPFTRQPENPWVI